MSRIGTIIWKAMSAFVAFSLNLSFPLFKMKKNPFTTLKTKPNPDNNLTTQKKIKKVTFKDRSPVNKIMRLNKEVMIKNPI